MSEITPANDAPWHAAYPDTKSIPSTMTRAELFDMMNSNKKAGVDYVLVDLRRADHEVRRTGLKIWIICHDADGYVVSREGQYPVQ
jgi:hypothetical protein